MATFPFIPQRDTMECGIASLAMVCAFFGKRYSSEFLAGRCFATSQGVSLGGIARTAESLGLDTCSMRLGPDNIDELPLPAILHWNQNHFVVLHRLKKGRRYYVADPGKGLTSYSREEFLSRWLRDSRGEKGIAMTLTPGKDFGKTDDDTVSEESRKSFGTIAGYLLRYRSHFIHIAAGLMLGCVLQLILPFLTQAIVDRGIHHKDIGFIWLVLAGELMTVAGRTATEFIRSRLLLYISMRVNISLLSDFFIKLMKLPMGFFDTKLTGDLLQRMADHERVQNFLTSRTLGIVFTVLSFLVFGVVLWIYSGVIFLIFIGGSALYTLWTVSFLRRRKVLDREMFEYQARNRNTTYQLITSMQEIKLQDCERRRRWEWEDTQADLFGVQMKAMKLQQARNAGCIFIHELQNILITVMAASAVIDGGMTLGAMLAVQYIIGQLNSPVDRMMDFVNSVQDVKLSLERINEVHTSKGEERSAVDAKEFADPSHGISLRNVCYKYDRHSPEFTLRGVTVEIPKGKTTAVVGASGSGKTTLVKLMLGYYPLLDGCIAIGGRPLADYNLGWWRRRCGAVMQEGVIFSESIARNIAVDDGEIDTWRMKEAARVACVHDFISSLPLGYDTVVGRDGMGLSRGQKQRLLIARAVYRDPEYLFLDEATNSLDARNERMIVENLARFYQGRTVVVVAHRLSTVRDADNIIVLDRGRVVEQGTHESLSALRGTYYSLVKNQLELGT